MKYLISIILLVVVSSCGSYKYGTNEEKVEDSNLTFGVVKSFIVEGKTTQEEILKTFGAPNLTTKNKSNNEVWSYNKMTVETKGGQTNYFVAQRASASTSSKSFDLIISFDENDIVKEYSVVQTSF